MVEEGVTHDAEGVALDESQAVAVGKSVAIGVGCLGGAATWRPPASGCSPAGWARLVTAANPRAELIGRPIGHLAALGLLGFAGYKGLQHVFHKAETAGDAVEAAYSTAPTSEFVSAGPRSAVSLETIGREGRRFVNMALTTEEIEAVMGGTRQAADPGVRRPGDQGDHQRAGGHGDARAGGAGRRSSGRTSCSCPRPAPGT